MEQVNNTLIFSPMRSQETWSKTLEYLNLHGELLTEYEDLTWAYRDVGRMIPTTVENFWSGHFFPYSESVDELQVSTNLAFSGFYKQAFVSLRSALELGLMSVYYNLNDDGHNVIQSWLKAETSYDANTPNSKRIWKILLSNENIKHFVQKYSIQESFKELGFLSDFVHSKGYKHSNYVGKRKSNYQVFESEIFKRWLNAYGKVIKLITTLHMLKYPVSTIRYDWYEKVGFDNPFPVCDPYIVNRLENTIGSLYFNEIARLAESDKETQNLMAYINQMPYLTESEQEEKILQYDKTMIECSNGFEVWKESELKLYASACDEKKLKVAKRIAKLEIWAREQGHYEPKL